MWKTVLRRLLITIPQLFLITLFIFLLADNMPGDALGGMISPDLPFEEMQRMREDMGLNRPWPERYFEWLGGVVRGDFGSSFRHARPVMEVIGERLQVTAVLAFFTLILTYLIAIPLGITAGRRSGTFVDKSVLVYAFTALAFPTIVLAILMVYWFSPIGLGWIPLSGAVDPMVYATGTGFQIFMSRVHHLIGPAVTGALIGTVGIVFMLRANIIERKSADYVTFGRSKGVPTNVIFNKHILRNSLVPVTASIGLVIVTMFIGSVFIERIFQINGMGRLFLDSVQERDFPVANAIILILSAATALGVLISDIILTIVDPRIRIQ